MFSAKSTDWLKERHLSNGVPSGSIWFAEGDISLSTEEFEKALCHKASECLVIDGNLTVTGHVSIDDMCMLVVTGALSCRSFWIGEALFSAKELCVQQEATFDCYCDDMHLFEVGTMRTSIWCTRTAKPPGGLKLEAGHVVETSKLQEASLFGAILRASFSEVLSALESGVCIDDAWCQANKKLVHHEEQLELSLVVSPRLKALFAAIEKGATFEETELQGQTAVRISHTDGSKQISVLSPKELAEFRRQT